MRIYALAMIVGVLLLTYAYTQFSGHHYALNDAPIYVIAAMILGGLGLMGGIFGFALAAFFQMLHGRKN